MAKDTKPLTTESVPARKEGQLFESTLAGTEASPVYRLDMGESLPPQDEDKRDK